MTFGGPAGPCRGSVIPDKRKPEGRDEALEIEEG
jgi:hypothetical protein